MHNRAHARNSEENKSVSVIVFQIIDIGAALVSIFNLIKEVLGWMS